MTDIPLGDTEIEISGISLGDMRVGGSGRDEKAGCPVENGPTPDGGCLCS